MYMFIMGTQRTISVEYLVGRPKSPEILGLNVLKHQSIFFLFFIYLSFQKNVTSNFPKQSLKNFSSFCFRNVVLVTNKDQLVFSPETGYNNLRFRRYSAQELTSQTNFVSFHKYPFQTGGLTRYGETKKLFSNSFALISTPVECLQSNILSLFQEFSQWERAEEQVYGTRETKRRRRPSIFFGSLFFSSYCSPILHTVQSGTGCNILSNFVLFV